MKKHTKEYAEKLAAERFPYAPTDPYRTNDNSIPNRRAFEAGYLAAIEVNAVPELIHTLTELDDRLRSCLNEGIDVSDCQEMVSELLNKINQ